MPNIEKRDTSRFLSRRLELGMTLEQVSSGICSVSYLSMIEAGKRESSKRIEVALSYRLGLTVEAGLQGNVSQSFTKALLALKVGDLSAARLTVGLLDNPSERDLVLGRVLEVDGELEQAVQHLVSAFENEASHPQVKLLAAVALVRNEASLSDYHRAIQMGETALTQLRDLSTIYTDEYFELRAVLSGVYIEVGDLNRSMVLVSQNIEGFESNWSKVMQLWAQSNVLEAENKFDEAADKVASALEISKAISRPVANAHMLQNHAYYSLRTGNFNLAVVNVELKEAEAVFRAHQSLSALANCLDSQALASVYERDEQKARALLQEAYEIVPNADAAAKALLLLSSAETYLMMNDQVFAKKLLIEARALLEKQKASRAEAKAWRKMSAIYESIGDSESVIVCLKAATELLGLGSGVSSLV